MEASTKTLPRMHNASQNDFQPDNKHKKEYLLKGQYFVSIITTRKSLNRNQFKRLKKLLVTRAVSIINK